MTKDIGSAFHVGDGIMVTAKHVVAGNEIVCIATTWDAYVERAGGFKMAGHGTTEFATVRLGPTQPLEAPVVSADADLAAFRVQLPDPGFPEMFVGGDDEKHDATSSKWMKDYVLEPAYVLGYPRIPSANKPILVGLRCDVSAIVEERYLGNNHPHFVLSSMARGGFSGGPVFGQYGQLIGIVTEAFLRDNLPAELGYMAVVPVDIIARFLKGAGMLPKRNRWALLAGEKPTSD